LKSRHDRLRDAGKLTMNEIAEQLDVSTNTVKIWRRNGLLRGYPYNELTDAADAANLVAWCEFENNGLDSSGNGHDGTQVNSPSFAPGLFGQALDPRTAAADGYFTILGGIDYAPLPTSSWTIHAWLQPDLTNNSGNPTENYAITQGQGTANPNRKLLQHGSSGGNNVKVEYDGAGALNSGQASSIDGDFHLLTMRYDASAATNQFQMLLDGNVVNSTTNTFNFHDGDTASDLRLGARSIFGGGATYQGLIDDVSIFNIALTNEQLEQFADGTLRPSDFLDQVAGVPEPSTFALAALGLLGLAFRRRRR
jgi:hypothetical protein